jgi:PAS domain S-box-containing protein
MQLLALGSCLPIAAMCGFLILQAYSTGRAQLREDVRFWRDSAAEQLDHFATELRQTLLVLGTNGPAAPDPESFRSIALQYCAGNPARLSLSWIGPDGVLVASSDSRLVPGTRPAWAAVLDPVDVVHFGQIVRLHDGNWAVPVSVPYRPAGRAPVGRVVLMTSPQMELASRLSRTWSPQDVSIMVLESSGKVLLHSQIPEFIGTHFPEYTAFAGQHDAGASEGVALGFDRLPRAYASARIQGTPWLMRASLGTHRIESMAWQGIRRSLMLLGLSLAVALVASRILASRIARSARALAVASRDLASGREGEPLRETGPAEIADIARAFNEMVVQRRAARLRLEESESRYRLLFGNMTSAFALLEIVQDHFGQPKDYRFIEVNPAFERLTGLASATTVGRTGTEVLPDTGPLWIGPFGKVALTGEPVSFDGFSESLGRHLEVLCFRPHPGQFAVVLNDVTERVRNREVLEVVHRRYQGLLDSIGGIVWDSSSEGVITYVSPQAERILGYPISRWTSEPQFWSRLLHPDDVKRVIEESRVALAERRDHSTDLRMVHAEGRTVWLRNLVTLVRLPGGAHRQLGVMFDITEQKKSELALRESERRLELALEGADLGFWDRDLVAGTVRFSSRWVTMLGHDPSTFEASMAAWERLVHPEDLPAMQAAWKAHFEDGIRPNYESIHRLQTRTEGWIWVVSRGRIVERDAAGRPLRAAGTHLDVTVTRSAALEKEALERKILETQKLESLGVLAGGIAHDFNNLLTGILGNASLARLVMPPGSPGLDSLAEVEQSAERAAHLCRQMLAYSGRGRFVVQRLDINQLIEDLTHLLGISIGKGVIIRNKLSRDIPAIEVDVTQIRQVLMNLVINASEAIGDRSGVIVISTGAVRADAAYLSTVAYTPGPAPGDYVSVEVSDNGCGMDPATVSRIFDPFFTTKFTGRGLGLAAVLGIVRGHRGAIKVYSEPGKGTTFKLLFPVVDGRASPLETRLEPSPSWRSGGEVLVIDDDETIRTLVARMLDRLGLKASLAGDPREGIELFIRDPARFRIVLLDLTMPHLGGEETFRRLRAVRPELPVVLMSGFTEEDAVSRFAGKGLAGFLQKPFSPSDLAEELRRVLESAPPVHP